MHKSAYIFFLLFSAIITSGCASNAEMVADHYESCMETENRGGLPKGYCAQSAQKLASSLHQLDVRHAQIEAEADAQRKKEREDFERSDTNKILNGIGSVIVAAGTYVDANNNAGRRSVEIGKGSGAAGKSINNSNCQTSDSPAPKPGYKKSYVNKSNNQRFTIEILGNTKRHRSYCYLGKKYYTVYVEGVFDYGVDYMPKAKVIYSTSINDKTFGCDGEIASIGQVVFLGTPESYKEQATTPGRFLGYDWPGTAFQLRDGVGDVDGHRRAIFDFLCK